MTQPRGQACGEHTATGFLRLERSGRIARLVLDRPQRGHAWLAEMWDEATEAVRHASEDVSLRVLVLESTGDRVFSGGADFDELRALGTKKDPERSASDLLGRVEGFLAELERSPLVVIGTISGAALGAGMEIASACDLRIASTTATFGIPAARLGIVISRPDVARLVRVAGASLAYEMLLTGRTLNADDALRRGIVSAVHPPDRLGSEAQRLAERIAELSPHSLASMKRHLLAVCTKAAATDTGFADSVTGLLSDELQMALSARCAKPS